MLNISTGVILRSNGDPTWYQPVLNAVWVFFSFHFKVHNHVSMCLIWLFYTKGHIHLHQNPTDYEWIHNPWHLQQDIWEVVSSFLSKVEQPVYLATPTMHDYISQNLSMLFLAFSFVLSITLSEKTYLVQLLLTITHFLDYTNVKSAVQSFVTLGLAHWHGIKDELASGLQINMNLSTTGL